MRKITLVVLPLLLGLLLVGCNQLAGGPRPPGVRIELQAKPGYLPADPKAAAERMAVVQDVLRKRVQGLMGVTEPSIKLQGSDRVVVDLPGITDAKTVLPTLTRTGSLEFYWLKDVESERHPKAKWMMEHPSTPEQGYRFTSSKGGVVIDSRQNPELVMRKVVNAYDPVKNPKGVKPVLTGAQLVPNATSDLDQSEGPIIRIQFNAEGTKIFRDVTRAHKGEYLAIFYDGRILTAPIIRESIPSGTAQISGFNSVSDAQDIAETLNAGALPVPLEAVAVSKSP